MNEAASFSWVGAALRELEELLVVRGQAYANTEDEFKNFAEQARLGEMTMRQTFRGMLGQKLTRESNLHAQGRDEDGFDSIFDNAGYAVLWLAYTLKEKHDRNR